jgi:hypothetical protein
MKLFLKFFRGKIKEAILLALIHEQEQVEKKIEQAKTVRDTYNVMLKIVGDSIDKI